LKLNVLMLCIALALLMGSALAQPISGTWSEGALTDQGQQAASQNPQQTTQYAQYYRMDSGASSGQSEGVEQFNIAGQQPTTLLVGGQEQRSIPYNQAQAYATFSGGNALWIQGSTSWTQYAQVPQGSYLSLIATTNSGGNGYLYEIYPNGRLERSSYYFFSPYTRINFYADTIGQHILLFSLNNQVSNAVIVDVTGYVPGPMPGPTPSPSGKAKINIVSDSLTGYEVYVDDVYQFTEGQGGIPDGYSSFTVPGNRNHKITIRKGGYYYSQTRYFASGREYTLRIY
jgi:hypothetical protein